MRARRPHRHVLGRRAVLGALTAALVAALSLPAASASAAATAYTAYVLNYNPGTVTPVNTATGATGSTITVGSRPDAIALSPDGTHAYVANGSNTVTPITLATGTPGSAIPVGTLPAAIAITPDGSTAYVVNSGSNTVTPINLATNTPGTAINVGNQPSAIAITPDGHAAYVTIGGANLVVPINLATNAVSPPITVGTQPDAIAITPDGTEAWVANSGSATVTPINLATNHPGSPISVGNRPDAIAITPDGTTAYIGNFGSNSITPITVATGTLGSPIAVGPSPEGIAVSPDGATAYSVENSDHTLIPIDVARQTAGPGIPVGDSPVGVAITPDQAPAASFTSSPGVEGSATTFDASASTVQYGGIANYHWVFGDGSSADTATPTTSHVYASSGRYTATLTETDTAGTSTTQVFTGQTVSRNGGPSAQASRTFTVPAVPPAITSTPSSPGNNLSPSWSFSGRTGDSFQCELTSGVTVVYGWAPCSSPQAYSVAGQPDGTYSFSVRVTDTAGDTSAAVTSSYTLDTTPPGAPAITAGPSSPANNTAPSWSFTDESGATFQCELTSGGTTVSGWATCASPQSYSLSGQPDGTYTLSVRATDQAGNTGSVATSDYTLDRSLPPDPTITAAPSSPGNGMSPSWSFTDEPGSTFQCQLTSGATTVSGWAPCSSPQSYSLSGQPDGTYTFSVKATDLAGNTSALTTSDYTLDTTPPAAPTVTGTPASPGNGTSPSWSFSDEPGATFRCELTSGATTVSGWAPCSSPASYDLSGQPDGVYTLSVEAIDQAGNTGPAASSDYTLDTTPPGVPSVTSAPASPGNGRSLSWSFTGDAGATFRCELTSGATTVSGWAPCSSPQTYSLSAQPDGTYTFSVEAIDEAGNTSAAATSNYTLDTTPPSAPTITAAPPSPGNDLSPTWSFTGDAGVTFQCELTSGVTTVSAWAPCSSPGSYDLSGQPDGVYTLSVEAIDQAGNTGPVASSDYTLDTTPPAAPTITAPPSPGNGRSPSWSFTDEPGATYQCQLTSGATTVSGWASCASPASYDLTGQPDGTYTLSVKATDQAGNTGSAASSDYTLDTTPPAAPTITAPASPGNGRSPSWSFTDEAGATFQCQLTSGATTVSGWAACSSPESYDLTGQPDGIYTLSVKATDVAGNAGPAATSDYTLDTTPPAAPTISASPASPGNGTSPSWSFTGQAGDSFQCELTSGPVTVISGWAPCSSSQSYSLAGQPDGTYTFAVKEIDPAGNSSAPATSDYTLDTAAPAAPTITAAPASPGNGTSPSWSFTDESGATFQCQLTSGATTVSGWTPCSSPQSYSLAGQSDGTYTLSVRATDQAGNTGPAATSDYTLDRALPPAPAITVAPASPGNDASPTWSFTGPGGNTLQCELVNGAVTISGWAPCSSSQSYSLAGRPDGTYTFAVEDTDIAGNTSPAATSDYTLDTTAPAAPTVTGPASPGHDTSPGWSFTGEPGATFRCELTSGATTVSGWVPCGSPHSYDLSGQPDGTYTFSVEATDQAGNTGPAATSDYTLDTTPPAAPTITAAPASPGNDTSPSWSFTGPAGATLECDLKSASTTVSGWAPCSSPHSYDLSGQPDGTYTFSVRATDAAGNTGPAATSDYTLDTTPPAAPTITAAPASPGNGTSPSWSFTGEPGATLQCELSSGGTAVSGWAACSSPQSYGLSGQPDGTYTFSVRATDQAGNTGPAATSDYTLDRSLPPAPTITAAPASPGNGTSPNWSFSGRAGDGLQCELAEGATTVSGWAPCSSPQSYDLSGRPDGTYTFSVRAASPAGNTGPAATSDYTLDTTAPPAPAITATPTSPGSSRSPGWSFTGEPGATFQCQLTSGATTVSGWASCSSPENYDLSGQPDGDYTFSVRATDAAGNTGSAATSDYTLDTTAPAAPTITTAPASPGNNTTPSWAFTGEPGVSFQCQLSSDATTVSGWGPCSSPQAYSLAGRPDGTYTFSVEAIDQAGNTSQPATSGYALDTGPVTVRIDSGPGVLGHNRAPTWSFSSPSATSFRCELTEATSLVSDWTGCTSPHAYDLSGQPDGTYTFSVQAADAAGNQGSATATYELDTTPPAAPVFTATPGAVGANRTPAWAYTGEQGATFQCKLARTTTTVSDWSACTSPSAYRLSSGGSYTFSVRATDGAGNTGPAASNAYRLATAPPPPKIDSSPGAAGSDRHPAWSFSDESGDRFECRLSRSGSTVFAQAACTSPQTYDLASRPDGVYTFAVWAVNRFGDTSSPTVATYQLSAPSPSSPAQSAPPATPVNSGAASSSPTPAPAGTAAVAVAASTRRKTAAPSHVTRQSRVAARRTTPQRRALAASHPHRVTTAVHRPAQARGGKRSSRGPVSVIGRALAASFKAIVRNADKTVFPITLLLFVAVFLGLQNRIDRRDPKLALAPVFPDPDIEFKPAADRE